MKKGPSNIATSFHLHIHSKYTAPGFHLTGVFIPKQAAQCLGSNHNRPARHHLWNGMYYYASRIKKVLLFHCFLSFSWTLLVYLSWRLGWGWVWGWGRMRTSCSRQPLVVGWRVYSPSEDEGEEEEEEEVAWVFFRVMSTAQSILFIYSSFPLTPSSVRQILH